MNDFASSADSIAEKLIAGGMNPDQAMRMALRMSQSREQASILGGVPVSPPVSDVPPVEEPILGGDTSKMFQRRPTIGQRLRDLPKDVVGAGEALASLGSAAALAPASMLYALRPGQQTQGSPLEFAMRNMYIPRTERGISHLQGLGEVLESLPQTGPLPELQAFTGLTRGIGTQLGQKARQAGQAMAPKVADVSEEFLRRQGLLMDVVKQRDGNWIAGDPTQTENFLLGGVEAGLARLKSPTVAGETPAQRIPRHEALLRDPSLNEESRQTVQRALDQERQRAAMDNWVQRNLGNYVKKEMGTPDDPVRKLMDQGITHLPPEEMETYRTTAVQNLRRKEGFPEGGMAQTALGREWENRADQAIESVSGRQGAGLLDTRIVTAGDIQKAVQLMPEVQEAERAFVDIRNSIRPEARAKLISRGVPEDEAHLLSVKMRFGDLAEYLDKKEALKSAEQNYLSLKRKLNAADYSFGVKNPWIQKLDPETKLYGADITDLGFDHIVDVLRQDLAEGRIRPDQLNKVSMEQAVRRTYEYDQEMAKKMRESQIKATELMPLVKEYPEGFKWVELKAKEPETLPEGTKRVQQSVTQGGLDVPGVGFISAKYDPKRGLDWDQAERDARKALSYDPTEKALKYEGETMGHCVGGYCPDVMEGRSRIYSLRDAKGEPHVTVEVQPHTKGFNYKLNDNVAEQIGAEQMGRIVQIKGKQNRKPKDEYLPFVQDFVRSGNWSEVGDPQNAGMRRYTDVFNDSEQRKIESLNLPVPDHHWLTGEQIQTLHNAINPEGKRLKYDAYGNIVGNNYASGGLVSNTDRIASELRTNGMDEEAAFNRALMLANQLEMAGGGEVKMAGGGRAAGKVLGKAAERATSRAARVAELTSDSGDKALPLRLPRANLPSAVIDAEADRVARQMLGEFVRSEKQGDTTNLAGRSLREVQRLQELPYTLRETGTIAQETPYTPRVGDIKVSFPGDQTVSNRIVESIGDVPIGTESQGGGKYALGQKHLDEPEFWKSNIDPAMRVQGKVDRLQELYEPERMIGIHTAMGPTSNNFAMHLADANLRAIDWSKVKPRDINIFDQIMVAGVKNPQTGEQVFFPDWPGLANPEAALEAMKNNSLMRKHFNDRMKTPKVTKPLGLPNGLDIQWAMTEPDIRNMEISMTGLMAGELKPGALVEAAGAPHNTYSHRILGKAIGQQEVLTPFVISFPDAAQHIMSTKRPADFTGTIQKVFPHQIVDDQYIDQWNQYRSRIKKLTGKKKGGKVSGLSALRK